MQVVLLEGTLCVERMTDSVFDGGHVSSSNSARKGEDHSSGRTILQAAESSSTRSLSDRMGCHRMQTGKPRRGGAGSRRRQAAGGGSRRQQHAAKATGSRPGKDRKNHVKCKPVSLDKAEKLRTRGWELRYKGPQICRMHTFVAPSPFSAAACCLLPLLLAALAAYCLLPAACRLPPPACSTCLLLPDASCRPPAVSRLPPAPAACCLLLRPATLAACYCLLLPPPAACRRLLPAPPRRGLPVCIR